MWTVKRAGGAYALATAGKNATIKELAMEIGLDPKEHKFWLTSAKLW